MTAWIDCGRCGSACIPGDAEDRFYDGRTETCEECGAVNVVSADEDEAWLGHWTCKHGCDDETTCPACDAEDDAAPEPGAHEDDAGKEGA